MLGIDLERPENWNGRMAGPLAEDASITGHWGGGPNTAGEDLEPETPPLTWAQKVAVMVGRLKRVLRIWHRYHVESKGNRAIAYDFAISRWGRIAVVLRGWRDNGGQWGRINHHTAAIVFVLGFGQKIGRGAWRMFGALWFAAGAQDAPSPDQHLAEIAAGGYPEGIKAHRHWNLHPETESGTSCCGDQNSAKLLRQYPARALPELVEGSKGRYVRLFTARLSELGYLSQPRRKITGWVAGRIVLAQIANPGCGRVDGTVDRDTWATIGKLNAVPML
jgi:hypothetical protein